MKTTDQTTSGEAITLLIDLKRIRDNKPVQLKATTWAAKHESDNHLIDRLMNDEQIDFTHYELVDYRVDQAQIEMF